MVELGNVHSIDEAVTQNIGEGRTYQTLEDNLEFRATYEAESDIVYVFLLGRSTQRRMVKVVERMAVWRHWLKTRSFTAGDYQDISRNPSYLLAMLQATVGP